MADLRGLADGFTAGFSMANNAITQEKELGLRDVALRQQQQNSDRRFGLAQEQFNYGKEADSRNFERQTKRDKEDDSRFSLRNALDQQQVGIQKAGLGLRQQELNMRQTEFNYQQEQNKRNQRFQDEMPVVRAFYDGLDKTGNVDPELYKRISPDNPLHPTRFYGKDAINNVMNINRLVPEVLNGKRDINDPDVLKAANGVFSSYLQRNIGEKDPQTGKIIKTKELGALGVSEDGKSIIPSVRVNYNDGTSALKPMTRYGSTNPNDAVAPIPLSRFMDELRGYGQMVGQLNQPARADFMNRLVNGNAKQEREDAKGYRSDMISSQKERAKAIAKDPSNADAISAQFDKLDDQISHSYGKTVPDRVTPVLAQWADGDPDKIAFVKQVAAAYTPGNNLSKEHLDAKYAEERKLATQKTNAGIAQQLRKMQQASPRLGQ